MRSPARTKHLTAYLLDSSILILALRARSHALHLLSELAAEGDLYISVVSRAEILAGMHTHEQTRTLELVDSLHGMAIDASVADRCGHLFYTLARNGQTILFPDALIAATALEHGLILVTTKARHFSVPNLEVRGISAGQAPAGNHRVGWADGAGRCEASSCRKCAACIDSVG